MKDCDLEVVSYQIQLIRLRLEELFKKELNGETWRKWKDAIAIENYQRFCSETDAKLLVAIGVMKDQNMWCRLNLENISRYYLNNKQKIVNILISYQVERECYRTKLPLSPVLGKNLQSVLFQASVERSEQTLRNWTVILESKGLIRPSRTGEEFKYREFSPQEVQEFITYAKILTKQAVERGRKVGKQRHQKHKQSQQEVIAA